MPVQNLPEKEYIFKFNLFSSSLNFVLMRWRTAKESFSGLKFLWNYYNTDIKVEKIEWKDYVSITMPWLSWNVPMFFWYKTDLLDCKTNKDCKDYWCPRQKPNYDWICEANRCTCGFLKKYVK